MGHNLSSLYPVNVDVSVPEAVSFLDTKTPTQLYRIAQEATTNALKHGEANRISIALYRGNDMLNLQVCDNGLGIPDESNRISGLGLRTMSYRTSQIDADLSFHLGDSGGTEVRCQLAVNSMST